ncbi:Ankyrin repeatcontaining protein [Acanthamoeba castellanii str. Neff]|uniref:Ankyrin repeatcontaining protein n=1 Tax=Acanthamoeba castellanii (strain ATCC 30010 / Neff) TaxID=1257118 RepID=L8HB25_ACACF|nr:Ankyrin repeatcontaining protein [Acanthamoeba castellanii str. Neff]ELR22410.1 Ankyrin repeatcontaining protein [Acanthamoeba castellanii str. Neff]
MEASQQPRPRVAALMAIFAQPAGSHSTTTTPNSPAPGPATPGSSSPISPRGEVGVNTGGGAKRPPPRPPRVRRSQSRSEDFSACPPPGFSPVTLETAQFGAGGGTAPSGTGGPVATAGAQPKGRSRRRYGGGSSGRRRRRYGSRAGRGSGILSDGEGDSDAEESDDVDDDSVDNSEDGDGDKNEDDDEAELIFNEEDEAIHVHKAYRESMHLSVCPSRIAAATVVGSLSEDNLSLVAGSAADKTTTQSGGGASKDGSKPKEKEKEKKKKRAMTFGQLRTLLTHHKDTGDRHGSKGKVGSEEREKEKERKRGEKEREKSERAANKANGRTRKDLHATTAPAHHTSTSSSSSSSPATSRQALTSSRSPSHSRSPSTSSPSHSRSPSLTSSVSPATSSASTSLATEAHPYKNHAGQTPLHIAIDTFAERIGKGRDDESDDLETVSAVIDDAKERGYLDETDGSGWTALHCASYKGNCRLITLLLKKGADPCIATAEGTTALIYFLRYGGGLREMGTKEDEEPEESLMTLRKFIEHGANLNAQNSNGEYPLHSAAQSGKAKHVEILLNAHRGKKGKSTQPKAVDPNTLNKWGETCLHVAARMGNTKVVRHLVRHSDIDVSIVGPDGTAREVALKYGHRGVIELMGGRGKDGYGDITLHRFTSAPDLAKIVACQRLVRKWRRYRRSFHFAVQSWRSRYESTPLKKRFRKVREIVDNQARYTDNLRKIHLHYWAPPSDAPAAAAAVRDLFGNLDKILTLAEGMTAALRERVNNLPDHHDQPISDSFVQYIPALSLYSGYFRNYDTATDTLRMLAKQDSFTQFLQTINSDEAGAGAGKTSCLHLESFLIMPVQQIPRYILLLEDLKKMTTYSKHVELPHTLEALQAMKDLAERINTKKGFSLAIELVAKVQTKLLGLYEPLVTNERRYVHEGWWTAAEDPKHLIQSRLARHLAGAKKEVGKFYAFVFNDCFVLAKPTKDKEAKPEDAFYQFVSLTKWTSVQSQFFPVTWGKHKDEDVQGLKVKKTASGAKTKWLLGDSKYQNVLWLEKLRTLNDAKDSQFGHTQQLSRSMIYLTQKGESALSLLHKSQQQLDDVADQ